MPSPPPQSTRRTGRPCRAQRPHQLGGAGEGGAVRRGGQDLAADMQRQPDRLARPAVSPRGHRAARASAKGMPNLSSARAGGDLGVRAGIHVRVDPQRHPHPRPSAAAMAETISSSSALSTLSWEMSSSMRQPDFARGFADAGEHDVAGRNAGRAGAPQLALADHVGPGAARGHQPQHGEMVVRLHRVVDLRQTGQRRAQLRQPGAHGAGGIHPAGVPSTSAMRLSGTCSSTSPSCACMDRNGRAAISAATVGSSSSGGGGGAGHPSS